MEMSSVPPRPGSPPVGPLVPLRRSFPSSPTVALDGKPGERHGERSEALSPCCWLPMGPRCLLVFWVWGRLWLLNGRVCMHVGQRGVEAVCPCFMLVGVLYPPGLKSGVSTY